MAHLVFDYQPDHDIIAAQIEADLATDSTDAFVIPDPWIVHPHTDIADTR